MKRLHFFLFGLLLLTTSFAKAQSAEEIITKHINAIGGKAVIGKITSQVTESEIMVMGSSLGSTTSLLVGKGFKNVANFNGQDIIQSITPDGGWMINPLQGMVDPKPLPEEQVKSARTALYIGGELYEYAAKGSKAELAGRESIEGVDAYKIKLTGKEGGESFYFIDPTTYYLIKMEKTAAVNGQDLTTSSLFSNFKKTDIGFVMPFTTVTNQGFEMTINVNKVQFNVPIDPQIFAMPK